MKKRLILIVLTVFCIALLFSCSDDQPMYNMDDAELSSITEVYDQYTGFSTDFKRSSRHGNADIVAKQRYFPIDAVEIELFFGFGETTDDFRMFRTYSMVISDPDTGAEEILYFDASQYDMTEFVYIEEENGQCSYNHSEKIIIPESLFTQEHGRIDIGIYVGMPYQSRDFSPDQYEKANLINELYYYTDGKTVKLSREKSAYDIWTEPVAEWKYGAYADNSELLDAVEKKYEFKIKSSYLFTPSMHCYDVGVGSDKMRDVCHFIGIGAKTAGGSEIMIYKLERCDEYDDHAGVSYIQSVSFNYKGDFSFSMNGYSFILYLWDDGVVLNMGPGKDSVSVSRIERILDVEENRAVKKEMEDKAFESKSFTRWEYRVEYENEKSIRITVANNEGEECIVFDGGPELTFLKKIGEFFLWENAIRCHREHIYPSIVNNYSQK